MGLDVYLYRKGINHAKWDALIKAESDYEEHYWQSFGPYVQITDDQKKAIRKHCADHAIAQGLDDSGDYDGEDYQTKIEEPSKLHPDNYFQIGYFRSSYNNGGINHILRNLNLPDLYRLFGIDDHEYCHVFTADQLRDTKTRVQETIAILKQQKYKVMEADIFGNTTFEVNEVIPAFMKDRVALVVDADYSSYLDALDIVIETIEYVLADPTHEYEWHWSG